MKLKQTLQHSSKKYKENLLQTFVSLDKKIVRSLCCFSLY